MSYLTKSEQVLRFMPEYSDEYVAAFALEDDEGEIVTTLAIDPAHYADFGYPHELTVTITPGDQLNDAAVPEVCCDRPIGCQSECVFAQPRG